MPRFTIVATVFSGVIFAVLIPYLEVNATHLLNPGWPSHARLHEAWQLLTNASLSILALWLVLTRTAARTGLLIALAICLSFLAAWALGGAYGGSMLHTDGTQMVVAGVNIAVMIVVALTALLVAGLWEQRRQAP